MSMYNCIIIDDEFPARRLLEDYAGQHDQLKVQQVFGSAKEGLEYLQQHATDILFLDIQMPEITGLDIVRQLPKKPEVVLTTAYANYAIEGFDLQVEDYLLKPFSYERFCQAVDKCVEVLQLKSGHRKTELTTDHIMIRADHKTIRVNYSEIMYIEGLKEYVSIYTTAGKRYITLESLKRLESILPAQSFARVHKSYIVNKTKVRASAGYQLELENNKTIPIGKSYRDQVKEWFG